MNSDMNQDNQNGIEMNRINFTELNDAIGMLAATLKSFYDGCVLAGFSRPEAFQLTRDYMLSIVTSKK